MLNRDKFLDTDHVKEFVNYLYKQIKKSNNDNNLIVRYYDIKRKCNLSINSFDQALEKYYWGSYGIDDTETKLNELANKIQNKLSAGDNYKFLYVCHEILDWGGGGTLWSANIKWLIKRKEKLITNVQEAINIFLDDEPDLSSFGEKYRSNAGMTKIYSLCKPDDIIIYDSRVAAALGMFIVKCFGVENIPDDLNICVMPAKESNNSKYKKNRNPEDRFITCNNDSRKHAESNIKSNWILTAVNQKLINDASKWNLRKIEAALFMIGYDLTDQRKSADECVMSKDTVVKTNKKKPKRYKDNVNDRGNKAEKIRRILFEKYISKNIFTIKSSDVSKNYVDKSLGDLTSISSIMRSNRFLKRYNLKIDSQSGPKNMRGNIEVTYLKVQ